MNKASASDGIAVELFQILKDDAGSIMEWITIFFKLQTKILKGKMIFFLLMDAIMLDNTIIIEKI